MRNITLRLFSYSTLAEKSWYLCILQTDSSKVALNEFNTMFVC